MPDTKRTQRLITFGANAALRLHRWLLAGGELSVLLGLLALAPTRAAELPDPSVIRWVQQPLVSSLSISPDGQRLAGIGGKGFLLAAFITDVDQGQTRIVSKPHPYGYLKYGRFPVRIHWISNDLLALDYADGKAVSIDLEGNKIANLGEQFIRRMPEKGASTASVLVYRDVKDRDIDVVDARTGDRTRYHVGLPGKIIHWAFDPAGALRAVTTIDTALWSEKTKVSNWYRADERSEWQLLDEGPITGEYWWPIRVLPELGMLAVSSRHERDTYAVFKYDTKKRQVVDLLAGHPLEDIVRVAGLDTGHLDYVVTAGIKPQISWFDARWAGLQAAVDTALPGRINNLQGDKNGRLLIHSYGDVDPGRWYVLDTKTGEMREVGRSYPSVDPKQMRPMETIRYAARDGMTINAYLTRPARADASPPPAVVMIHGGPNIRDGWGWDAEVQMLAGQGYAVFQPQFRGSSGFGRKFEEAGYRQWGRTMQDDITDGVMHLIERKLVDPSRICIYGASYGGYAALWGVIKTPELYKCGVSFAGVSDLTAWAAHSFFDDSTAESRQFTRVRVGDAKEDKARLDEVSPLRHADQVRVPLLIAHGERDTRVLAWQSKDMVRALEKLGKPVETMWFDEAGHSFDWERDELRFYTALVAFLKRHIGDATTKAADVAPAAVPSQP
jgi:dipeptidyl aminopeptidase/acylaminoacyl peptidase